MRDDRAHLRHILQRIERIKSFTRGGREEFLGSAMIQDAVLRNFEIVGEATKRLSQDARDMDPAVPWRRMAGFRDVLIHQYEGVGIEQVWSTVESELPKVEAAVAAPLKRLG